VHVGPAAHDAHRSSQGEMRNREPADGQLADVDHSVGAYQRRFGTNASASIAVYDPAFDLACSFTQLAAHGLNDLYRPLVANGKRETAVALGFFSKLTRGAEARQICG
jgi:hypothetical protein